ncbi:MULTISPECIES: TspO/MBR family protein [unclassified Microcoleus]|jgi:translocator protein|uniref:TspO/MBR family protein n=1 Tax=unclassified Microcoleus TaxID=2642155 RepID=UPI001D3C9D23|nr:MULTISPECIES: TspO/MBR family protein [unclassified Microcoleus]MCC3416902.1 TspO/MBR family protein [Microcoleus sp. PH2017_07_MST_O_A]MCC3430091.1 TspO/MBR family protein [Microcoleus sp. PH2017_04_SCI_O_A]MCC3441587.1 TspO/MBR family protein [Microcoleus sp. PH2017_03_ELD_O_A]MCC3465059.1 TspO/MBR family protein [Microcoleus sp. PH2017_06_SFM_O_A]MCC3502606.1 TspO/MBR family protein [Microcoleus sp. PH2017_19_SFW_U_A]MCC3509316.1 TspO/MBR family protein [Microcoleus sp. PH2017_17_BER_D_
MIKSWMVIGAVVLIVALAINRISTSDIQWFNRLVRPRWLKIEAAIPIIWTVIFICGAWSAVIVWEQAPGTQETWLRMGLYLLLEIVTMSYTSVMCKVRSLKVGTIIGGTGAILSVLLALSVLAASESATLLLLPYILWSPIGTYTTWAMMHLNPADV